jgi:hypothetical protein
MKKLITYSLLVLILTACIELDEERPTNTTYTLSGHLYKNCEKEPFANKEVYFYKEKSVTFASDRVELITQLVTDESGFFTVEHDNKSMDRINAEDKNGNGIFSLAVADDDFRNNPNQTIDYYSRTRLRHPIKILTDKPYTEQDTLFVETTGNYYPVLALSGPFTNNQIGETDLMSFLRLTDQIAPFSSNTSGNLRVYWCIGRENLVINNPNDPDFTTNEVKGVQQRICDGDTIVIDMG